MLRYIGEMLGMGSHPDDKNVVPRDCKFRLSNNQRIPYDLAAHCMVVSDEYLSVRRCYLHKLRTKRPASCFNAIHCRLCLEPDASPNFTNHKM